MDEPSIPAPLPPGGQMLIYRDGATRLQVRLDGQTVWLTQAAMAELFQTTPQNITLHLQSIYDEWELDEAATCKEYLQVRQEGGAQRSTLFEALQPGCHLGRWLSCSVRPRHGLSPMGHGPSVRASRQGLHP